MRIGSSALMCFRVVVLSTHRTGCLGLLVGLLVLLAQPAAAQPGALSGFPFLRVEPSARAAALGGAFSAVYGDDVNALFYNPALLNESMHGGLSLSYLNHLADLNAGFAAYSRHVEGIGTFGAGLRYLSYGDMERADEQGNRLGDTFGASEAALTLGVARALTEQLRYGASAHLATFGIDSYRASALAFDLGVLYLISSQQLTFSASVNNLGVTIQSLGDEQDELPLDLRLGVAKQLRYVPLMLSVTGYNLHDVGDAPEDATAISSVLQHITFGGEFQFSESFQVRFGYNHRRHEELKMKSRLDLAGLGVGFGIKITRFRFDYAYNTWSSLGGLHQFTVRTEI